MHARHGNVIAISAILLMTAGLTMGSKKGCNPVPSVVYVGQGESCAEKNVECTAGLTCVAYHGFAGEAGPLFQTCEIPCEHGKDCPAGQECGYVADGPGQVCIQTGGAIGGQQCGKVTCSDGEVCCNASCGICTPPGGACTKQLCLDEPAPGEPCGKATCTEGLVCCNASCGICTKPGGFCTQQACLEEPAPVGEKCGKNTCAKGEVCCNASCGICTPPGGFCTMQYCGDFE